jgi:cardiolipin synthase A/B
LADLHTADAPPDRGKRHFGKNLSPHDALFSSYCLAGDRMLTDRRRRWWRRALWIVVALAVGVVGTIVVINMTNTGGNERAMIQHRFPTSDPQFMRTMNATFSTGILAGNRIETLLNGDEIFPAMLAAIREARDTINFETYIYWDGMVAQEFATALAARASEGVEVRVLIDWVGSQPMEPELITMMTDAGVRFERFRPLRWYDIDRINNRTHRKLLIVDGRTGFTGGVGIADKWRGAARGPDEWRDNHYRVEGPVVARMQAAFAENWLKAAQETFTGDRFYPELPQAGDLAVQVVKSTATQGSQDLHQMLMMAIASAGEHIRIGMAYFVPDDHSIAHLIEARRRGVEVDIIVPNEHIDFAVVRKASRHFWGDLLRAGVRIHEFQPTMYHSKFVIIDDRWVTLGSANFDERSFSLNDEANLNVYDEAFAREQIRVFDEDLARTHLITLEEWENRPLGDRFRDYFWSWWRSQF